MRYILNELGVGKFVTFLTSGSCIRVSCTGNHRSRAQAKAEIATSRRFQTFRRRKRKMGKISTRRLRPVHVKNRRNIPSQKTRSLCLPRPSMIFSSRALQRRHTKTSSMESRHSLRHLKRGQIASTWVKSK